MLPYVRFKGKQLLLNEGKTKCNILLRLPKQLTEKSSSGRLQYNFLVFCSMNIFHGKTTFQLLEIRFQKIMEFYIKPKIFSVRVF